MQTSCPYLLRLSINASKKHRNSLHFIRTEHRVTTCRTTDDELNVAVSVHVQSDRQTYIGLINSRPSCLYHYSSVIMSTALHKYHTSSQQSHTLGKRLALSCFYQERCEPRLVKHLYTNYCTATGGETDYIRSDSTDKTIYCLTAAANRRCIDTILGIKSRSMTHDEQNQPLHCGP